MDYRTQVSTIHEVQNEAGHALPGKITELELTELCTQMAGDDGVLLHHTTDQYHNIVRYVQFSTHVKEAQLDIGCSLFSGADAVAWLLQQGICNASQQAEALCDRMLKGGRSRAFDIL
jgi:Zn/Cd-binding protein ZinT